MTRLGAFFFGIKPSEVGAIHMNDSLSGVTVVEQSSNPAITLESMVNPWLHHFCNRKKQLRLPRSKIRFQSGAQAIV